MNCHRNLDSLKETFFNEKATFSGSHELAVRQSKEFAVLPRTVKNVSLWDRKPPDFSPKLYKSLGLPQTKVENRCPPLIAPSSDTLKNITKMTSSILHDTRPKKVLEPFVLRHQAPDSLESKLMFVKFGKYPEIPYRDPKPHDFRQYSEVLPDIVTTTEKDPYNLNFKSQHLCTKCFPTPSSGTPRQSTLLLPSSYLPDNPHFCSLWTIWGSLKTTLGNTDLNITKGRLQGPSKVAHFTSGRQTGSSGDTHQHERLWRFDTFKPAEPKWDVRLILPKKPWPNKSASYTRHKRRRRLYSAFMDRVEEKLTILWKSR